MKLEEIGFYTLSDERAETASIATRLYRGEIILTDKCNFSCPYCRGVKSNCKGEMSFEDASSIIVRWAQHNLYAIRFSGGEPTLYPFIEQCVSLAQWHGISKIAVSTNGSAERGKYDRLLECGVNDFSISLDACCSAGFKEMAGSDSFKRVTDNIRYLSTKTYVTVGVVLNEKNLGDLNTIIEFAHNLGVADIRIIPSAQFGDRLSKIQVFDDIIAKHPILKYRLERMKQRESIRGIGKEDHCSCPLVLDDVAVAGKWHFPCIIYLREQGEPIGLMSDPDWRIKRLEWFNQHDTKMDKICSKNCLDVCVAYNNLYYERQMR